MTDVDQYRHLLLAHRATLLGSLTSSDSTLATMGPINDEDFAAFSHDRFISVLVKSLDFKTLRLIDQALQRLTLGEYGECTDCGKPIPAKRLHAVPWATRCISCQESVTERQDVEGDSATAA